MSLRDGKCCYATRSVRCVGSVATRREGLLRNDKCDFVTISVVTSLDHSVGSADTSRRFHRHFSPVSPALLKCFVSFRRLCRHFSQASPALLAGSACSSRRTLSVTYRGTIPPLFSNVYSLLAGSSLQQSYFALNYYFK